MDKLTFNRLLKKAKYNTVAFEKLFVFYYKRIVFHLTCSFGKTVAEDAAQEFFLNIIKKDYQTEITNPTAWVYACAENIAKRMISKECDSVCLDTIDHTIITNNLSILSKEELFGDLYEELNKLSNEEIHIIYLIYWEGYNLKEIAEILGITYSSARQKHSRAIKKLKAKCVTF